MKKFKRILLASAVLMLFALSGCGQTGPLYLPDDSNKPNASY